MEAGSNNAARTFAAYLARNFIARKGYVAGTVPEAASLAAASDIVLTRSDGMSFGILCMIDREANPGKQFGMSREAVEEIGKACLKYSGKVHGNQMPVTLQIMEVGHTQAASMDQDRLKAFKRRSMFSKVMMHAWIVAPNEGSVWTNMAFNGRFGGRKFIEQLMAAPRTPDAELPPPAPAAMTRVRFPALTLALLAMLAAVFAAEHVYGIGASSGLLAPSIQTLVALGGLNRDMVIQSGEWYRIFSAALLHGDLMHLLLNGLALYLAGTVLESLVGRAWFFALFVIGAAGGSLMSLALNPASVVSVGASGAIMGLLAAAFVCSFRIPSGALRTQIQMAMLQVLVPSLIPLAVSRTGAQVDFAGHLGGALSGALVGMAMLRGWRPAQAVPGFAPLAAAISLAGFVAFAVAFFPIAREYPSYALETLLIPRAQLPQSNSDAISRAADLVTRYPRDPRSQLFHASALLQK
ncbi:MAG TPA: rhomboid family intramembrane serine protease, partial [Burkholderiales bacterium]